MRIRIERRWPKSTYIIGRIYIDGEFFCNSLELPYRNNQNSISSIPTGTYEVINSYSAKFKRVLPLVLDVPGRSGIRFHRGNYPRDSHGCIICGENTKVGCVYNSTQYEQELVRRIDLATSRKEMVILNII